MDRSAEIAALPFALLEELKISCAYERSFKIVPGAVLANRYMLGVDLKQLDLDGLLGISRRLRCPAPLQREIEHYGADANLALLGFEQEGTSSRYKIYLEFWEQLTHKLQRDPSRTEPTLLHLGLKWDARDCSRYSVAHYICHPMLPHDQVATRVAGIFAGRTEAACHRATQQILTLARKHVPDRAWIYLEASETDNHRKSCDVNLYRASLNWQDVRPVLEHLWTRFAVDVAQVNRLWPLIADKPVGHISSGIDRHKREFFTGYFPLGD